MIKIGGESVLTNLAISVGAVVFVLANIGVWGCLYTLMLPPSDLVYDEE